VPGLDGVGKAQEEIQAAQMARAAGRAAAAAERKVMEKAAIESASMDRASDGAVDAAIEDVTPAARGQYLLSMIQRADRPVASSSVSSTSPPQVGLGAPADVLADAPDDAEDVEAELLASAEAELIQDVVSEAEATAAKAAKAAATAAAVANGSVSETGGAAADRPQTPQEPSLCGNSSTHKVVTTADANASTESAATNDEAANVNGESVSSSRMAGAPNGRVDPAKSEDSPDDGWSAVAYHRDRGSERWGNSSADKSHSDRANGGGLRSDGSTQSGAHSVKLLEEVTERLVFVPPPHLQETYGRSGPLAHKNARGQDPFAKTFRHKYWDRPASGMRADEWLKAIPNLERAGPMPKIVEVLTEAGAAGMELSNIARHLGTDIMRIDLLKLKAYLACFPTKIVVAPKAKPSYSGDGTTRRVDQVWLISDGK